MSTATDEQLRKDNEDALKLMRSEEWKQFIQFLKRRMVKLQNRVNDEVEKGNIIEAKVELALMKDCAKTIEAFTQQTLQTRSNMNKEQKNG